MRIAVGIVFHGHDGRPVISESTDVELLVKTNARNSAPRTPWLGFGANHNHFLDAARGATWYVALNPDVEATAEDIRRLVAYAEDEKYSIVAPIFEAPWGVTGTPQPCIPGPYRWLREAFLGASAHVRPNENVADSKWVSGACMAIRLADMPLRFDERYFMYFEDVDLCWRARAAGRRVGVCTDVVLRHASGWSSADPLLAQRGTEFAHSALLFAGQTEQSIRLMRMAGLIRFGSRLGLPGRTESERASARAISTAFLPLSNHARLADLAQQHNEQLQPS
jgi:GT2 family glycosyltransferase